MLLDVAAECAHRRDLRLGVRCRGAVGSRSGVDDLAADIVGGVILVIVEGQHGGAGQVAGDDGGHGDETLKHHRLHDQGIEVVLALSGLVVLGLLQHFLKLVGVVVETGLADGVHVIAELGEQRAVDVPAVLGRGVLQGGDGVDADAVIAVGLGALPDALGDHGEQVGAVLGQHVVELHPVAVAGVAVVLVGGPVAGEDHVDVVAAGQGGHDGLVEVTPGAPDDFQLGADLVLQVDVQFVEDLLGRVGRDIAAVEPDLQRDRLFGPGGGSDKREHHDQCERERENLFHVDSSVNRFFIPNSRDSCPVQG